MSKNRIEAWPLFLFLGCGVAIWASLSYKWHREECLAFSENQTQFEECMK